LEKKYFLGLFLIRKLFRYLVHLLNFLATISIFAKQNETDDLPFISFSALVY